MHKIFNRPMSDFAKFLKVNGLKRKDIASFLGVSGAFITQISSGDRPLPEEKLAMIKANDFGWDISMLTPGHEHYDPQREKLLAVYKRMYPSDDNSLIGYLQRQVEDKDRLIQNLYQQIGMLEAKNQMLEEQLEQARKGETASIVTGFSAADAV